jgi:hypothetical protein
MIPLDDLLNIICTEALEHSGAPEVPDHKHGATQNYSTEKRDARGSLSMDRTAYSSDLPPLRYDLELVRRPDGTLNWEE